MSSIIYGITAVVALALVIWYLGFCKNKDIWLLFLFISVLLVNVGYFSISVSHMLEEALLANRISYLGSVFLPLCMLMSVTDVCGIKTPKWAVAILFCVSVAVFILAASPGYCDWYYKDVTLQIVDGTSKLVKVYGDLHIVYCFYLFAYFSAMIIVVGYASIKKKITSHKYASMLTVVVFLNILIWLLEQLIPTDYEFLSISYIVSELILLFLYSILHDFDALKAEKITAEPLDVLSAQGDIAQDEEKEEEIILSDYVSFILEHWELTEALTSRELEVLPLILDNCKRKEIAQKLCLSENTVKTHTSHIFTKLGVAGRVELAEKALRLVSEER
ncbi:MAG: hypothetical protein E7538_07225 [Ruminococcaceae bacterium]|nr:hypothetical protein [Oscillospiraceae bacterium]